MGNEIVIGAGGLLLSVLTYFAGVRRTENRHKAQDSHARIERVFQQYMDFRRRNYTDGCDGAQKAGIATLVSSEEIHAFAKLVVAHGQMHPLGSDHETVFAGVDLPKFFRYAAEKRVNFLNTPVHRVIEDSGAKA